MGDLRRALFGLWFGLSAGCSGTLPATGKVDSANAKTSVQPELATGQLLADAEAAYTRSDYAAALARFARIHKEPAVAFQAQLGIARVQLATGGYAVAAGVYESLKDAPLPLRIEAALVSAEALRRSGDSDSAERFLREASARHGSVSLRVTHGETLIALGRRKAAEAVLMTVIEDYNQDRITKGDGYELGFVARAAHLLRSPEDANDAFNEAEQVLSGDSRILLWRAELYLEKYDPGHAEEVVTEVLTRAPNHPDALVWMAEVKLAQSLDFGEAKRLAQQALTVNPALSRAYFVLAGLSLRDMRLEQAESFVRQGLGLNPKDLELLSMQASVQFLADDHAGFERTKAEVFKLNPEYSRFYQIVGEYAEWEHRYEEVVTMMRAATEIDDDDARAHAQLGLNLIRNGDDRAGLASLRKSFAKDPFNVRVYNTLNLYEKTIANHYVDVPGEQFNLRYSKVEKPLLERYVPKLLNEAWEKFEEYYKFSPLTPVGVELYAERESFAIRTSGLPQTAIQGVCFGKTVASMSPRFEQFNLGMTLWHELAHVFHIQLSKNHVPRWFTEGLAEYETLVERIEWKREKDAELFAALRDQRLPKIGAMNEAFTHAEDLTDVTVAYYASTQVVRMLAETYGRGKLREMLVLWGEGKRTEEVIRLALGVRSAELDTAFALYVDGQLARYKTQFVPVQRTGNAARVQERVKKHPREANAHARFALLALQQGDDSAAAAALETALKLSPGLPDALWLKARLALRQENPELALTLAQRLVASDHDGYETQMIVARAALMTGDLASQRAALAHAARFDPTQAEAHYGLVEFGRAHSDAAVVESSLATLIQLEEHNGSVFQDYMNLLLHAGRAKEAVEVGRAAVFADMEGVGTHLGFAKVLVAAGDSRAAEFQFESAIATPGEGSAKANAHLAYAEFLKATGRANLARVQFDRAKELVKPPMPPP